MNKFRIYYVIFKNGGNEYCFDDFKIYTEAQKELNKKKREYKKILKNSIDHHLFRIEEI